MFKPARHTATPTLSVLAAVMTYGLVESFALLRSRAADGLVRLRSRLTGS